MADYRQESQEYARGAMKATATINGGAAVAVLTQVAPLLPLVGASAIAWSIGMWVGGIVVSALCWLVAFLSTRHVDRSEEVGRDKDRERDISDRYMLAGIVGTLLSILMFAAGAAILANAVRDADVAPPSAAALLPDPASSITPAAQPTTTAN